MSADQTLTCRDCGVTFLWTVGEQEFFAAHGFAHAPTRCPSCRRNRRLAQGGVAGSAAAGGAPRRDRPLFSATCSGCGGEALVPFQPRLDKPVYCNTCFQAQRPSPERSFVSY